MEENDSREKCRFIVMDAAHALPKWKVRGQQYTRNRQHRAIFSILADILVSQGQIEKMDTVQLQDNSVAKIRCNSYVDRSPSVSSKSAHFRSQATSN